MPPGGCKVASVLSPLQSSCRLGSSSPIEMDLAVLGGVLKQGSPDRRVIPIVTLRIELSCRVFLVS